MIFHVENPQEYTKKLLQLIHEFNKAAGYKSTHTHTHKSHFYTLTMNMWSWTLTQSIYNCSEENWVSCINIIKYAKALYPDDYRMLVKESKDLSKWNDTPCLRIRRLNIVKMSVLLKLIYINLTQFLLKSQQGILEIWASLF